MNAKLPLSARFDSSLVILPYDIYTDATMDDTYAKLLKQGLSVKFVMESPVPKQVEPSRINDPRETRTHNRTKSSLR